ncbi:hypothetical protein D3C75_698490 [compost metagenome]
MEIQIKGTSEIKELVLFDSNGVNWINDFIGNNGGLRPDGIAYDAEHGTYSASEEEFAWWEKVVADQQQLDNRIAELKEAHGAEAVDAVVSGAADVDLEDYAAAVNAALDEEFGVPVGK